MNNFFKIHKVKILRQTDNLKFSGSHFKRTTIIWAPFPSSVPAFFVIAKGIESKNRKFQSRNNKKELHSGRGAGSSIKPTFIIQERCDAHKR
jgi:hypothetical protein